MKAEVRMYSGKIPAIGPFRPGVWLNKTECEAIIDRLPEDYWIRVDLIKKLAEARAQAERQTAAWAADKDCTAFDV